MSCPGYYAVHKLKTKFSMTNTTCWLFRIMTICIILAIFSPVQADQLYAIWKSSPESKYFPVQKDQPVGGNIFLRLILSPSTTSDNVKINRATITELANPVHAAVTRNLPAFTPVDPDSRLGDPTAHPVLQSCIRASRYHNGKHRIAVDISYVEKGSGKTRYESYTTDIVFKNLTIDYHYPRIFGYDPFENPSVLLWCDIECAQSGTYDVTYEVFAIEDNTKPIYIHRKINYPTGLNYSYQWDGTLPDGTKIKPGFYTYRTTVQNANDELDRDTDWSPYLSIRRAEPYSGKLDDDGFFTGADTPGYHGDDYYSNYMSYSLVDSLGKPAKSLQIFFNDPDFHYTAPYDYTMLPCIVHKSMHDGIDANRIGILHVLKVKFPGTFIQSDQPYMLIVGCLDDHAALYKNHRPKPAVESD
ncbi:MAG: hypothetical protein ACYC27_12930 [Armatimonadota bacterium]